MNYKRLLELLLPPLLIVEGLMARTAGRYNTVKIVPLVTFQGILERCKQIEEGTFFPH